MKKYTLLCLCLTLLGGAASAQTLERHPSDDFRIGVAGYSYRNRTIDQALESLRGVGVKYMSVKDFHLPYDSSAEEMAAFKQKLAEAGVEGYILGPIYMRSEAEVDRAFEYVRRYGHDLFIGVPNYELLPYMEEKVKEYDIRVAIHNHGPDNLPFPDADEIMERIGGMDARIGICLDLGHTVRYGADCVEDIRAYRDRVFDIHIKDVTGNTRAGGPTEMGRGVMDYAAIVRALRRIGYTGTCSLEFEKPVDNPDEGIRESIGYFRGICDATK